MKGSLNERPEGPGLGEPGLCVGSSLEQVWDTEVLSGETDV